MQGHPWFAALYDPLTWWAERWALGPLRDWLLSDVRGRVLEIGAGTGANLPHYARSAWVVASDPDPYMLRRATRKAKGERDGMTFLHCRAEALPFRDDSFDVAVMTLVLCTVEDPAGALQEARRVLRPSGELRLIEHVRAEGWLGRAQDAIAPLWRRLGAGCNPNRRTGELLRRIGFELEDMQGRELGTTPLLVGAARPVSSTEQIPSGVGANA